MVKITTSIILPVDIITDPEIIKLRQKREFSNLIEVLLRTHLKIKTKGLPEDMQGIEEEIQEINVRKALLLEKKSEREKQQQKKLEEEKEWKEHKAP